MVLPLPARLTGTRSGEEVEERRGQGGNAKPTAERFHRAEGLFPELRTGDYGWLDDDGYLYFSGRRDDLYKERGFRVSVTEVETAARTVEGVTAAALLPPRPRTNNKAILAVVTDLTPPDVLDKMRGLIEDYKIPSRCVPIEAVPLNNNGKVDRRALADLIDAHTLTTTRKA